MVDELRFGAVGVNVFSAMAYSTPHALWGGFQGGGSTLADVRSGLGCINNTLMFDHPQKWVTQAHLLPVSCGRCHNGRHLAMRWIVPHETTLKRKN
jgi:aldehyde dehydrogenase (NAD(P)+)